MKRRFAAALTCLGLLVAAQPAAALITNVDEAADLCSAAADPCVISDTVETVDGAVLDFGTRTLEITAGGLIDAGPGDLTLKAGRFYMSRSGVGIKLHGPLPDGTSKGGYGVIEVRRRCSGDTSVLCLADSTCAASGDGTCTVGDGNAVIDAKIDGNADVAGNLSIRTAGDVDVLQNVTMNATFIDEDGGVIELDADGAVTVESKLQANSGGSGTGGDICIIARTGILANDILDASGGDFDGGTVELDSNGDITLLKDIEAQSTNGEGFGGEIDVIAGGKIDVIGGGAGNPQLLKTEGHSATTGFSGDGGPQCYDADGNVHFGQFARPRLSGAAPEGSGDSLEVTSRGDILIEGDVTSVNGGLQGAGGEILLLADGTIDVTSTSSILLTGGDFAGGLADLNSGGDLNFAGLLDVSGTTVATPGNIDLESDADVTVSGTLSNRGALTSGLVGSIDLLACHVDVLSGADIDNRSTEGRNTFQARERITIAAGATVMAPADGLNQITYRTATKPPVVTGAVSPAAILIEDSALPGCPVCGNGEVDQGETCDDGGLVSGDGCSDTCQDEGCIAETPGYPMVPLCSDGNPCTDDVCANAGAGHGSCTNPNNTAPCDDGVFCNGADTCDGGSCSGHAGDPCVGQPECRNTCDEGAQGCADPIGTPCADDGNPCTNDVCDGAGSCVRPANVASCDDGVFCNGTDTCALGGCSVHSGNPCPGPDGDATCTESCSEGFDACIANDPNGSACDDGVFCNGADTCQDGSCSVHAGDPCSGAPCDEQAGTCESCLPGDCNMSGGLDAGDPICTVLCLTGSMPPGGDCLCAADCNCLQGTDAGDPVCAVLRLIGAFDPDTCVAQ